MSLGLVSYDDSDESDNENDSNTEMVSPSLSSDFKKNVINPNRNQQEQVDNVTSSTKDADSSEHLNIPESKLSLLNTDIDIKSLITSNKRSGPVKISIPSLNKVEEETEEPHKKKIKPSQKGSGLFALLPSPKSSTLVPQSINRTIQNKNLNQPKKPTKPIAKPIAQPKPAITSLISYDDSGDEEESAGSVDFFSLESKDDDVVPVPVEIDLTTELNAVSNSRVQAGNEAARISGNSNTSHWVEASSSSDQTFAYSQPPATSEYPTTEFMSVSSNDLELDQQAMQQLCGRRDRLKMQDVQVIDVSGDAMLADSQDWLTKQLTEEVVHRPSHKKKEGPTSQQKRKHQITYLAHQAKENELELKNQWANNRMSRKQTQAKYGF